MKQRSAISVIVADDHPGAKGLVLNQSRPNMLIECIRTVDSGENWFPAEIADTGLKRKAHAALKLQLAKSLTTRELEVIAAVSQGKSNKEVARELGVSEPTAKIHLHNIFKKLKVTNRTSLAAFAIAHGAELAKQTKCSRKNGS